MDTKEHISRLRGDIWFMHCMLQERVREMEDEAAEMERRAAIETDKLKHVFLLGRANGLRYGAKYVEAYLTAYIERHHGPRPAWPPQLRLVPKDDKEFPPKAEG